MKKKILFIIGIISIIGITKNCNALDFTVGETTYQVDSESKVIDYCYFYFKSNNALKEHFLFQNKTSVNTPSAGKYYCYTFGNYTQTCGASSSSLKNLIGQSAGYVKTDFSSFTYSLYNTITLYYNNSPTNNVNWDLSCNIDDTEHIFTKNISYDEIECRYNTCECSENVNNNECQNSGGGGSEEPTPDEPTNTNNYEVYMYTGLVLLALFIWLRYFRDCFHINKEKY